MDYSKAFTYNNITPQYKRSLGQLSVQEWNRTVNVLITQANANTSYLDSLHHWIFPSDADYSSYTDTFKGYIEALLDLDYIKPTNSPSENAFVSYVNDKVQWSNITVCSVTADYDEDSQTLSLDFDDPCKTTDDSDVKTLVNTYVEQNQETLKGDKGDTGATGATGATGPAGKDGADGKDGATWDPTSVTGYDATRAQVLWHDANGEIRWLNTNMFDL